MTGLSLRPMSSYFMLSSSSDLMTSRNISNELRKLYAVWKKSLIRRSFPGVSRCKSAFYSISPPLKGSRASPDRQIHSPNISTRASIVLTPSRKEAVRRSRLCERWVSSCTSYSQVAWNSSKNCRSFWLPLVVSACSSRRSARASILWTRIDSFSISFLSCFLWLPS